MQCSLFAHLLVLLAIPATCLSWPAKVVSIADGDTFTVLHNDQPKEIRLYGIDCPEKGQNHGDEAKALTSALVAGRNVDVDQKDIDRYGRVVGLVLVDGQSLNELIVQNGYAWVYPKYCEEKFCSDWMKSEKTAKRQKKGIWNDSVVVPPWEWRTAQRGGKPAMPQSEPSVILIGEEPNTVAKESLLSKIGKALTRENSSGSKSTSNKVRYRCDGRTYCSQMTSCDEATFFLENCPGVKMDGNRDGVPCERQWCH